MTKIIVSYTIMLLLVAVAVVIMALSQSQLGSGSTNGSKFLPVPTCTYNPVIVCTMPPLNSQHAVPCNGNPATPCLPPQNRTSEGVGATVQAQQNNSTNPIPTCSIPPLNGSLPCNNENKSISLTQSNSWLDNLTGPHYAMPCKDSPSTMCYYPAPSRPTQHIQPQPQQPERNGTIVFGLPFAKTRNNITITENPSGGCLDDPAVACGP